MNIQGKIIELLPLQSGTGKNGVWRKQDFILEIEGNYSRKICVSAWGNKIDENQLGVGNTVDVLVELESREFNGRWYTDVRVISMKIITDNKVFSPDLDSDFTGDSKDDDFELPF